MRLFATILVCFVMCSCANRSTVHAPVGDDPAWISRDDSIRLAQDLLTKNGYPDTRCISADIAGKDDEFLFDTADPTLRVLVHVDRKAKHAKIVQWIHVPPPAQETATSEEAYVERRVAFFQQNFSKFVPLQFKKDTNSNAAIQILHVKENTFVYDGTNYCGFKFTVPQWLDGDFMWTFLVAKTETNKDFNGHPLSWYIIPETGRSKGFENFQGDLVANHPLLHARFPYSHNLTIQNLAMERLIPGKTYGIWFGYTDQDQPDFGFAMTITSDHGAKEFGDLPLR